MNYKGSELYTGIMDAVNDESALVLGENGPTKALKHVCRAIASGITDSHNKWQGSCKVNNVLVSGGSCAPSGPLSGGTGIGAPGSISKTISGTASKIIGYIEFEKITKAQKEFLTSVAEAFEEVQNSFYSTATITQILVSQGSCSCKIVSGAPVPGSYSDGVGKLVSLSGNIKGQIPTKGKYKTAITDKLKSSVLQGENGATKHLKANINALATALASYHDKWMSKTKLEGLKVSGGVTIVGGPVAGAIGKNGVFV